MKKRWIVIIVVVVVLGIIRLVLPILLEDMATKKLSQIEGHKGIVEDIDLRLYRLAYIIDGVSIVKTGDSIPEPFMEVEKIDISLQWEPLWKEGKLFADIIIMNPYLNFVVVEKQDSGQVVKVKQFGQGVDWMKEFRELNPFEMDNLKIEHGTITYNNYTTDPQVNLNIDSIQVEVANLRGKPDTTGTPLPASLTAGGNVFGKDNLSLKGEMNMRAEPVDFDGSLELENASLVELNNLLRVHTNTDVHAGRLSVYSELVVKNSQIDGYVKPVIENLDILNWETENEPFFSKIGEAVKGFFAEIIENQEEDQIATSVPLSGNLDDVDTATRQAVLNLLKNAFIEAFDKELNQTIEFGENKREQ